MGPEFVIYERRVELRADFFFRMTCITIVVEANTTKYDLLLSL